MGNHYAGREVGEKDKNSLLVENINTGRKIKDMNKKRTLLFIVFIITTIVSCSSEDDKISCSELNIFDPSDNPCEVYAEDYNCSCN
ncbi:hypothetical protein [uncultured Marixanthomonas sp.]|uniref:hypothetical protein n=1 Tax=uncultured Marixanthomonas sp. TaxID=757245 RepID=UPI0030D80AB9|tara:strand:+ start:4758 stop:5015 length:258 start_codon:yes stop_codon:yes gene_type:complete